MRKTTAIFVLWVAALPAMAIQRFPKPEFETGYSQPQTLLPGPRLAWLAYLDVVVLIATLSLVTWLVLRRRSRKGVFWTSLFSLAYFGFYREGCVCSVGSLQNVTLALFNSAYVIPYAVLAFFVIPLAFALFSGRTFCAAVCPFGVMQDLFAFSPIKLGTRLNAILGLLPYLYLGFAVLYAATGTDFIICRYDPFVGIFRMNASFGMFVFAGTLLLSGVYIARPYCRFLCPYGVLLKWFSYFSRRHMTITPGHCIQCRLCEDSCPYDAILVPVEGKSPDSASLRLRKLILITALVPVLSLVFAWTASRLAEPFARLHPTVKLAAQLLHPVADAKGETFEMSAFRTSGKSSAEVFAQADILLHRFTIGSWILGAFLGLSLALIIATRMLRKYQQGYVPDKGSCYSCMRCTDYCPVRHDDTEPIIS